MSFSRKTAIAATLAASLALVGCTAGGEGESQDNVTIRFLGSQPNELIDPVVKKYNDANPGTTVVYESVPFESFSAVIAQRVGGDTGDVDVFYADAPRNPSIINAGYALDLTGELGDFEGTWAESSIETATVDGKIYTAPMRTSTQVLYYNVDLLAAAGVDLPSIDPAERITWEELKAAAAKAQDAGAKWGYLDDQVSRYYQFQPLPESLGGGSGLSGDENLEGDLLNPKFIEATEYWQSLYSEGLAPKGVDPDQTKPIFQSGQAAFMPGGPWWMPVFAEDSELNVGIAAYPRFEDGEAVTPTDSEHLAVSANTKHPDEAIDFVKWITLTEEGALAMSDGLAVPTANLEAQPIQLAGLEELSAGYAGFRALAEFEMQNTAVARPASVGYVQFEDVMGKALEDIRNGSNVTDRLGQANEQLMSAFSRLR
ncbi:MAG: extracellular solute-binding protein [Homoserinimonas sp.]